MEKVNLNKISYFKGQYERVIDTKFSQLVVSPNPQETTNAIAENAITPSVTIDQFFQYYNELFFQIPKRGAIYSHEYIIKTSSDYINFTPLNDEIQALIDEINILQQNNLELSQQLADIQSSVSSSSTI